MGDIGSRQVRYEVLSTASRPDRVEPPVPSAAPPDDRSPQVLEPLAARVEPARR